MPKGDRTMEDYLAKVFEGLRQQLIAAGEIGPDDKLSGMEIQERYEAFCKKKIKALMSAGIEGAKPPTEKQTPVKKKTSTSVTVIPAGKEEPKSAKGASVGAKAKDASPEKAKISDVEEARKLLLENPELMALIQKAGKKEIERGSRNELVSPKHASMFQDAGQPSPLASPGTGNIVGGKVAKQDLPATKAKAGDPKPREALTYAIEQLAALGMAGYNQCLIVVDGCWINFENKAKKKQLYLQVAGNKYISKKSHLGEEHVKMLADMGIPKEEASIDIFSTTYNKESMEIPRLVDTVFQIFNKVLRVSKGAPAYMDYGLGPKPTPEHEAVFAALAGLVERRDGRKFHWKWL